MEISKNLKKIFSEINLESKNHSKVKLIAVSKLKPANFILEAFRAGQLDFGENYVQEAKLKKATLPSEIRFHLIGPLQKNKVKYCPAIFSCVHSLSDIKIAEMLDLAYAKEQKKLDVLIQMNLSNEESKSGLTTFDSLFKFARDLINFKHLNLIGLMTMPSPNFNKQQTIDIYNKLRNYQIILQQEFKENYSINELSMGMSEDYKIALKAGATFIRIGSAIFGNRD